MNHPIDTTLPRIDPNLPRRQLAVLIEVPENWEKRLDHQWIVQREITADRWSWHWPDMTQQRITLRQQAYAAIDGEREYQRKWEDPTVTDSGGRHSNVEFLVYIQDYVNEALHFASRNPDPQARPFLKHSLRKIAALAVAAMEQNGIERR